ncbi:MAG: tRNA pseudouridine(55) synthase TruB [Phycisphaerales bacterium]|nr:MAG: tRNA pseudouridine(55) synthase TruB [Phycisphaerales bacterium]
MGRSPRNSRPDLNGVLVVDKPLGASSMDVCRVVRRRSGGAKVGHAGTLDPLATGVLVVCLGTATRAIDSLMATEKVYEARVDLSAFSTTDDMEGEATPVEITREPSRADIERACAAFVGEIMQAPPSFSAVHIDGQRAYRLARRGELGPDDLPARPVTIHKIVVREYAWPFATIDVRCGKGTYIRSLARDIGRTLGTGGRLAALRRTRVGAHTIEQAIAMDAIPEPLDPHHLLPVPDDPRAAPPS